MSVIPANCFSPQKAAILKRTEKSASVIRILELKWKSHKVFRHSEHQRTSKYLSIYSTDPMRALEKEKKSQSFGVLLGGDFEILFHSKPGNIKKQIGLIRGFHGGGFKSSNIGLGFFSLPSFLCLFIYLFLWLVSAKLKPQSSHQMASFPPTVVQSASLIFSSSSSVFCPCHHFTHCTVCLVF